MHFVIEYYRGSDMTFATGLNQLAANKSLLRFATEYDVSESPAIENIKYGTMMCVANDELPTASLT